MFKVGDQVVHKDSPNKALVVVAVEKEGVVICQIPGAGKTVKHKEPELRKVESGPMRVWF